MHKLTLVVAFLVLAVPALAQTKTPLLDYSKRLSLGTVGRYDWQFARGNGDPIADPGKEFTFGVQAGYLLSPQLTLSGGSVYGTDTKQVRSWIGLSYPLYGKALPAVLPGP